MCQADQSNAWQFDSFYGYVRRLEMKCKYGFEVDSGDEEGPVTLCRLKPVGPGEPAEACVGFKCFDYAEEVEYDGKE